jgi:hypothetical protein
MHNIRSTRKWLISIDIDAEIIYFMKLWRLAESWDGAPWLCPVGDTRTIPHPAGASAGLMTANAGKKLNGTAAEPWVVLTPAAIRGTLIEPNASPGATRPVIDLRTLENAPPGDS